MPAVIAIAKAPQNATRTVALATGAPPAFAPLAPRIARKNNDEMGTLTIIIAVFGVSHAAIMGSAAPAVNVAAEVSAACTGRAVVTSVM